MRNQLQQMVLMVSALLGLGVQPVWADTVEKKIINIPSIREIKLPLTSAEMLVQLPASEVVQVTGVKANPTDKGVEVILETTAGKQLQVVNRSTGNNFIVDIPNAQLRLPSGEAFTFRSQKPLAGITEITVTNFNANTIRLTAIGEVSLPVVELFDDDTGLIFSVASVASATPSPQPQTQPTPPTQQPESQTQPSQPSAQDDEPIELVVTGEQDGYRVPDTSTATRTDTPLRDIPQSIQVIPQQVLEDQQVNTLLEVLKNVPGTAQSGGSSRTVATFPLIRGFDSTNNIFKNGLRTADIFNTNFAATSIERVEVLKGPASVLFGLGSLGGTINLITKQPLRKPYYSVEASAGSFNSYSGALDFSGPLNESKTLLYRLNASAETTESFVDIWDRQRYYIGPSLTWLISDQTKLTLEFEFFNILQAIEPGIPAVGTVLPNRFGKIPRNRFVGEPSDRGNYSVFRAGYNLEHRFSDNWQLNSVFRSSFFHYDRTNVGSISLINDRTVGRTFQLNDSEENFYNLDTYMVGKFATGSIQHQLLFGVNLSRRDADAFNFGSTASPLDLFNPVYGRPNLGPRLNPGEYRLKTDVLGIYVQDQVTLADNLKLLLGGRFDIASQDRASNVNSLATSDFTQETAFSPRVGIVYQPIPAISLYASYGQSFQPQGGSSVFISSNVIALEPEQGEQYEVGIKADLSDRLAATLAFYDLTRSNVLTAANDPNNPSQLIPVGKQRSKGIEFDITGEILSGWNIIAGYAYTDARVEEDNTFAVGNFINNVPKHSFNIWTTYEFQRGLLQGFGFGAGVFFTGDRQGDLLNTFELPGYLRTDAAIFYKRGQLRASLNFRNLFDVDYFEAAQNRVRVNYGDPFTVQGTISWQF